MSIFKQIVTKLKSMKSEIYTLSITFNNPQTPLIAQIMIGLAVGYFLSPIDLIPDFIPIFGVLDDIVIVPTLIWTAIRLLPPEILLDSRQKAKENPIRLSKNNWTFGIIFILIWIVTLFVVFKFLLSKSK
jgi:uncharacterized membrane protein YkvA (DUF1232 family)